jgi:hypothetical protein
VVAEIFGVLLKIKGGIRIPNFCFCNEHINVRQSQYPPNKHHLDTLILSARVWNRFNLSIV